MEENYWTRRRRYSRRSVIRGIGVAAGVVSLAPIIAACGSNSKNNKNNSGKTTGGAATTAAGTAAGGTAAANATSASGVDETKAVRGATSNMGIFSDFTTFDTKKSQDVYSNLMISQVTEAMFYVTPDSKIAPRLAVSVENPDSQTYVFKMRPNVTFQDGTPFDANAVKTSIQRHIDDKASVRRADITTITGMNVVDPMTLQINLSAPFAPFLLNVGTGGAGSVYSPTALQKLGDNINTDLTGAGSGPFKFVEWAKADHGTLAANETYWAKAPDGKPYPYLAKIVMKVIPDENVRLQNLKAGDIDILYGAPPPKDVASLKTDPTLIYKEIPGLGFSFFNLEVQKPPFDKKEVRQAFAYAIDRDQLLKTVQFNVGVVWDSEIAPTVPGHATTNPYLKQDIAKAKSLLQQAGVTTPVAFSIEYSSSSPVIEQTVTLVKDQIQAAGFNMSLTPKDFTVVVSDGDAGNYQAESIGWSDGIDPDGYVYNLFQSKAGFNLSHYNNPQVDALLEKGRTTLDIAARIPIYQQLMQLLADDEPFIVYYIPPIQQVTSKKIVNYPLGPSVPSRFLQVWKTA